MPELKGIFSDLRVAATDAHQSGKGQRSFQNFLEFIILEGELL